MLLLDGADLKACVVRKMDNPWLPDQLVLVIEELHSKREPQLRMSIVCMRLVIMARIATVSP